MTEQGKRAFTGILITCNMYLPLIAAYHYKIVGLLKRGIQSLFSQWNTKRYRLHIVISFNDITICKRGLVGLCDDERSQHLVKLSHKKAFLFSLIIIMLRHFSHLDRRIHTKKDRTKNAHCNIFPVFFAKRHSIYHRFPVHQPNVMLFHLQN